MHDLQLSLFSNLDDPLPAVAFHPNYLSEAKADRLFEHCLALDWQQNHFSVGNKIIPLPRLETLYGDSPAICYSYSGQVTLKARPWTPELEQLRDRLERDFGFSFQAVVGNLYRTGQDSIGWHADDEPSLGPQPAIASISLGATRRFRLKPKTGRAAHAFDLGHGSLLLMLPGCQEDWLHEVPKTTRPIKQRINLTFRPFF
ncbi:MAG: alpha-ketoglutarate-dependent dioxygenase AlkB [Chloroflexaceae bacterium]|nr:alpha-ketoglutarate-dependent dioxygenase AlkB [Chloroflexaceae bacterium]